MITFQSSRRVCVQLISTAVLITSATHASTTDAAAVLVSAERSVRSSGSVLSNTTIESWSRQEFPANKFDAFNFTVDESRSAGTNTASGFASIDSLITTTKFSGSGVATGSAALNEPTTNCCSLSGEASSRYQVTFTIVTPTFFSLEGVLSFDNILGSGCCGGGTTLSLRNSNYSGPTYNLSFGTSSSNGDFTQNIFLSGMLDPNTYTLEAIASSNARGSSVGFPQMMTSAFDFTLTIGDINPVPLPGTVWLMLTGIMGIVSRSAWRRLA